MRLVSLRSHDLDLGLDTDAGGGSSFLRAFAAGFLATLVFHQGAWTLLWLCRAVARAPYDLTPSAPLGVPAVISLAFFGGLWGAVLWPALRDASGEAYWMRALVIGALAPSAVALFVVFPLKHLPVAGGFHPGIIATALFVNGVWGLGTALLLRPRARGNRRSSSTLVWHEATVRGPRTAALTARRRGRRVASSWR